MTADNIEHVISYWVMFQTFHSPTLAGFAIISHWVPFLLFSLHMGAAADRRDCRKLIQISQVMYVIASLTWGLLFLLGALQMWHAVVMLLLHGMAGVIAMPAQQLIIHDMVPVKDLPSAIRLNASSRYLSMLLGPAIGGGLMLLLGPAWGLLANAAIYLPFSMYLFRVPYTGHTTHAAQQGALTRADVWNVLAIVRSDPRMVTMILLAAVSSFFVGNAFQAQMPEYAAFLGADETGTGYTVLLAANAAGAVLGVILLEMSAVLAPSSRTAIICAGLWAICMGLFPMTHSYATAVGLLVIGGVFGIAFTSMAQTVVQMLAPARVRGTIVGLFTTAMMGMRAGAGVTIGVVGAFTGVHASLALSCLVVLLFAIGLFMRDIRMTARMPVPVVVDGDPG